jgi:hypothetical protein
MLRQGRDLQIKSQGIGSDEPRPTTSIACQSLLTNHLSLRCRLGTRTLQGERVWAIRVRIQRRPGQLVPRELDKRILCGLPGSSFRGLRRAKETE